MHKFGLQDTMGDLTIDTVGALIVSVNGVITMRAKKNNILTNAISRFMKKNPDMEKKHG